MPFIGCPGHVALATFGGRHRRTMLAVRCDHAVETALLGSAYSDSGSGALLTYTSRAEFALDMTPLLESGQGLLVGLLDPTALGIGFDTLGFQIEMQGSIVTDETFTSLGDALAYFDDRTLTSATGP